MAGNTKYYYSLPTPAPQHHRSGSRRPPLTPSTVSSPCVTTTVPIATRRDSGSGSPTKASALLAKVACHPTTPRNEASIASPISSPTQRPADVDSSPPYSIERPAVWRSESARYVGQYRQQDGYISFPDFEKFCQTQSSYESQHREHTAVKT
ncbi:hypothetical protein BDV95DRAFT_500847 [Massariosphaeria phaeospora]|uniref:Uncharacterized protein n=1 Tax=Massariosphaeria phaeospora TaxID=100035 RepID=A0A7C8IAF6_9PLEO|nr:hypothetical protein BDV95DRAFT_500847 [Massariosphaeria phaeospora]